MKRSPISSPDASLRYRGSALLASGAQRVFRVLLAVVFLWALTGWAMDWW
jgi:hypothetical protein